jgi:hypothetical protein
MLYSLTFLSSLQKDDITFAGVLFEVILADQEFFSTDFDRNQFGLFHKLPTGFATPKAVNVIVHLSSFSLHSVYHIRRGQAKNVEKNSFCKVLMPPHPEVLLISSARYTESNGIRHHRTPTGHRTSVFRFS